MKKDPTTAKWHHTLLPKKAEKGAKSPPPQRPTRDDDSSVTEDLVHQMYL